MGGMLERDVFDDLIANKIKFFTDTTLPEHYGKSASCV